MWTCTSDPDIVDYIEMRTASALQFGDRSIKPLRCEKRFMITYCQHCCRPQYSSHPQIRKQSSYRNSSLSLPIGVRNCTLANRSRERMIQIARRFRSALEKSSPIVVTIRLMIDWLARSCIVCPESHDSTVFLLRENACSLRLSCCCPLYTTSTGCTIRRPLQL